MLLTVAAFSALAAAALSLIGAIAARPGAGRRGLGLALTGLVVGMVIFGIMWQWRLTARRVPPIHDITTDTENPPAFLAMLPIRMTTGAPNSPEYGGPAIAAQQRAAWPTLGPLRLPVPPQQAFERAWAAARAMGWEIVEANATEGRIEATDTTFWFGFKDDIVIRVAPDGATMARTRIDARSVSRVGKGDVGTNARRIQAYLAKIVRQS